MLKPIYLSYVASVFLIIVSVFYINKNESVLPVQNKIAKNTIYKELNVGFSKQTQHQYQAIVAKNKEPKNSSNILSTKEKKPQQSKYTTAEISQESSYSSKRVNQPSAQNFKPYITQFFEKIVSEEIYQRNLKREKNITTSNHHNTKKLSHQKSYSLVIHQKPITFHYKKIILGSLPVE